MASPFFPRMQRVASGLRAGHDRRGRYSGMGATGGVIDSCPIARSRSVPAAYGGGEGIFKYIEGLPLGHRSATAEELMSTDTREQEITWLARSCSSSGSDPNKKISETDTASVLLETITYIKFLHGTEVSIKLYGVEDTAMIQSALQLSDSL
uniref:Uncharacterized protein n=1 Tax=Oryza nivara TaxID=4536 RepID=A0A0E0J7I9_ORYNI